MATFSLLFGFALVKIGVGVVIVWLGFRTGESREDDGGFELGGFPDAPTPPSERSRRARRVRRSLVVRGRPARRPTPARRRVGVG